MPDYSEFHSPVTDLFNKAGGTVGDAHRLSKEQINHFQEQGYLAGIRVLSPTQIEVLRDQLSLLMAPDHEDNDYWYEYHANESADSQTVLFHALGAWRISSAFHDLLWNPAFTIPASQLLGGAVRFWHDQLFCKPARHGGVVAWHQDYSYWTRTSPMAHLTCWIGLDDSDTNNGCVQYIPRSHKWNLLPITGLAGGMEEIRRCLDATQQQAMEKPVAIALKAGECSFHHPLMVHGSGANITDRSRRATVINVIRDGVCSGTDEPLLANTTAIPKGQPLSGQFFPLLQS